MRARDFAGPAYRFLFTQAGSLASLAVPAIAVMLVVNLPLGVGGADIEIVLSVSNLVAILVLTQYARVVYGGLLAGRPPALRDLPRLDGRTWSLLWRTVAMTVVVLLPAAVTIGTALLISLARAFGGARGYPSEEVLIWVLVPPGVFASLWLATRLALVPVLAVTPGPLAAFATSWSLTRGHGWLVLKLLAMILLPWIALRLIGLSPLQIGRDLGLIVPVVYTVILGALDLAAIAVVARALVALYRALTAGAAAAPRSAPGAPSASP